MKTVIRAAAQGDMIIIRVDALPEGVKKVEPVDGKVIVAHSETGHHHVMDAETTTMYRLPEEIYEAFIVVDKPTVLTHMRDYDTHEPHLYPPGTYKIMRQRETAPDGLIRPALE